MPESSFNCKKLLKKGLTMHDLGASLEKLQRDREEAEGKVPNKRYRGYIHSIVSKIRAVKVGSVYFEIIHLPSRENHSHCHIKMRAIDDMKIPSAQKMLAKDALKDVFSDLVPRTSL